MKFTTAKKFIEKQKNHQHARKRRILNETLCMKTMKTDWYVNACCITYTENRARKNIAKKI